MGLSKPCCAGVVLFGAVFAVPSCASSHQDVVSSSQPTSHNLDAHICVAVVDGDVSFGCFNIHCSFGIRYLNLSSLLNEGAEMQSSNQWPLG